jgi:hypothetical protein
MESVILNGIEVKVGSLVRLIDDSNIYDIGPISETIIRPVLYGYYIVRGFAVSSSSNGSFLLEGINNKEYKFPAGTFEPGFSTKRFIAVTPLNHTVSKEKKKSIIKIKIQKEVVESLDLETVSCN